MKMYSVYDSKAQAYQRPFIMRNSGEALRAFGTWANDPKGMLCTHAEDFVLYEIAEFDENTGNVLPHKNHSSLGKAIEYKRQETTSLTDEE
jgi:hypothetical protein